MLRILMIPALFVVTAGLVGTQVPESWGGQRDLLAAAIGLLGVMVLLADLIEIAISSVVSPGSRLWCFVIAPGTILHELGHYIMCKLTGLRVTDMALFQFNPQTKQLGYVSFEFPRGPGPMSVVQGLLVAMGPFFTGCLAMFAILTACDPQTSFPAFELTSVDGLISSTRGFVDYMLSSVVQRSDISPWNSLAIYGLLVVGTGAAPSTTDFLLPFKIGGRAWVGALVGLVFIAGLSAVVLFHAQSGRTLVSLLSLAAACQVLSLAIVLVLRGVLGVAGMFGSKTQARA